MGMFEGEMSREVVEEGGGGERNVGIPKINSHLLERHKTINVCYSSGCSNFPQHSNQISIRFQSYFNNDM